MDTEKLTIDKVPSELKEDFRIWDNLRSDKAKNIYLIVMMVYAETQHFWLSIPSAVFNFTVSAVTVLTFPVWGLIFDLYRSYKSRKINGQSTKTEGE